MKITNVHFERVYNIGNFQSERVGADVAVEEGDSPDQALQLARQFVWANRPPSHYEEPPPAPLVAKLPGSDEEEGPRF